MLGEMSADHRDGGDGDGEVRESARPVFTTIWPLPARLA
jgi:hypothetical protein